MPFTVKAPATANPGKPWSQTSQRSRGESFRTGRKPRQRGDLMALSLTGTYSKPWRSMGTDRTASLANLLRHLARQSSFSKSFAKVENRPVWHGVDLQQDSVRLSSSACDDAAAVASAALRVQNPQLLQGVLNCLVLAETVYRVSGENHDEIASVVSALRNDFPGPSVSLDQLQWSLPHVAHRYMLAEDADALYVCFIGTKQRRDIVTNANIMQDILWPDLSWNSSGGTQDLPAAHAGFLNRARDIPIQDIYQLARQRNKRLVLTGHSLGGAVALLCMLDLLYSLGEEATPHLSCIAFATPAVGNAALAEFVRHRGWDKLITNYLVPEDVITRLLPSAAAQAVSEAANVAAVPVAATQAAGPAQPALWATLARQSASSSPSSPSTSSSSSSSPSSVLPPSPWDLPDIADVTSSSFSSQSIWKASLAAASPGGKSSSSSSSSFDDDGMTDATQTVQSPKRPVLPPRFRPSVRFATSNRSKQYSQGRWQQPARQLQHNYLEQSAPTPVLAAKPVASNNIVPLQARALGSFDGKPTSLLTTSLVRLPGDSSDRIAQQTNTACTTNAKQAQHALEDLHSSPASIQQQAQWRSNLNSGTGIWTRTAQLARLVSFPVRATRAYYSYVPFGQQLYLNPQAVATSLEPPSHSRPAAAAAASTTTGSAAMAASASPAEPAAAVSAATTADHLQNSKGEADAAPAALGDLLDVVVQQRREQLGRLWMHRMPTYRARFQQILFAALGLPLPDSSQKTSSQAEAVTLSKPIAPVIHVIKAETSCKALTSQHLKGILQDGLKAMPTFRWFWIWSGAWPAIRQRLYSREQDTELLIAIQGHGLEHATHTLVTFGTETLPCSIAQQPQATPWRVAPHAPWLSPAGGFSALQAVFAMVMMTKPAVHMAVRVSVPARVMRKMQQQMAATGNVGVEVTMQSDFCSSTASVSVQSDVKALQDRFAGMLAVCRLVSAKQPKGDERLPC